MRLRDAGFRDADCPPGLRARPVTPRDSWLHTCPCWHSVWGPERDLGLKGRVHAGTGVQAEVEEGEGRGLRGRGVTPPASWPLPGLTHRRPTIYTSSGRRLLGPDVFWGNMGPWRASVSAGGLGHPPSSVCTPVTALGGHAGGKYSPTGVRAPAGGLKPPSRTVSLVGSGTVDGGPVSTNEHLD